jgi:predicted histidine transporter YuiF (NhaC family)
VDTKYPPLSFGLVAFVSAIALLDLALATNRLYSIGAGWEVLLSALVLLIGVLTAWVLFYRQYKEVQEQQNATSTSHVLNSSLGMVLRANLCVLGALGLAAH